MNSYQNKNEYEILNAPSNNTNMPNRYPFANDPNAMMKNGNYKDWLDICNPEYRYSNPEAYRNTKAAMSFGVGLVSTILGVLGGPISVTLGAIIGVVTAVLEFIPADEYDNTKETWGVLIAAIKELIYEEIKGEAMNAAKAKLDGLYKVMKNYDNKLNVWKNGDKSPVEQNEIQRVFADTNNSFLLLISQFQQLGHEVSFLPLFAVAANFHLLLLRDVSIYGKEWGYTNNIIEGYHSDQLDMTQDYTNYAVDTYNKGLEEAKKIKNSDKLDWDFYNQYRRDMTLTVLDVIALFPTYDVRKYPISTKVELTREIYTDMINYINNPFMTNPVEGQRFAGYTVAQFNSIENALTREPHLFTWLKEVTGYFYAQYGQQSFMTGIQNTSYRTNYEDYPFSGPLHGVRYAGDTARSVDNNGKDVYSIYSTMFPLETNNHVHELRPGTAYYFGVKGHRHDATDRRTGNSSQKILGEDSKTGRIATGPSYFISEIPYYDKETNETIRPTPEKYNHRLSYISAYATDCGRISGVRGDGCFRTPQMCAWTHVSADPYNTIHPDKITQISAVKAFYIWDTGEGQVVSGPGFTGGDLVKLPYNARLKIRLKPTSTSKKYRVRVRYASMGAGTLRAEKWSPYGSVFSNFAYEYTGDSNKFNNFKYLETLSESFNISGVEIIIQNLSSSQLIVDKLEFIPI
uniref:Crystaline entomocidal protoxin n=1 Tax=Bacillus thuringiensis subsp. entomocidus TaxID=1436 RepID=Q75QQ5_BACTE|nr:putative mosquitocidal toxin [Bacillus thuringiensis serovar entomocidus]